MRIVAGTHADLRCGARQGDTRWRRVCVPTWNCISQPQQELLIATAGRPPYIDMAVTLFYIVELRAREGAQGGNISNSLLS